MSLFSQPFATDRSYWYPHCQLSLSSRVDSVYQCCDDPKMGILNVVSDISANTQPLLLPIAVNVCPIAIATQSWSRIQFIPSITAGTVDGMRPMVPLFRYFIDRSIQARGCSLPQSCMSAQCAQLNSPLQWACPHPYHVKKHTGPNTATSSSMGPLCTQACIYPTKDSDRAVCYSIATSLLDQTVPSSIRSSSLMWFCQTTNLGWSWSSNVRDVM